MVRKLDMEAISALHSRFEQPFHPQLPGGGSCCAIGNTLCQLSSKPKHCACKRVTGNSPSQTQILCNGTYMQRLLHSPLKCTNLPQSAVLRYSGYHSLVSEVGKGCTENMSNCSGRAVSAQANTTFWACVMLQSNKSSLH